MVEKGLIHRIKKKYFLVVIDINVFVILNNVKQRKRERLIVTCMFFEWDAKETDSKKSKH